MKTQILEVATKHVEKLHVHNVNRSGSHLIFSSLKPIPHHLTRALTKFESIIVTPCLVCNHCFHYKDIIVVSCGYTYHAWSLVKSNVIFGFGHFSSCKQVIVLYIIHDLLRLLKQFSNLGAFQ